MLTKMAAIYEKTKTSRMVKDYIVYASYQVHKNTRTFYILLCSYVCALAYQNTYVASCIVLFNILVNCYYYILRLTVWVCFLPWPCSTANKPIALHTHFLYTALVRDLSNKFLSLPKFLKLQ